MGKIYHPTTRLSALFCNNNHPAYSTFCYRVIVHTLLYKYTKSLLYFALWFALSQRIIFVQIEAGPTDQPRMLCYDRLILLAALKLLGGE